MAVYTDVSDEDLAKFIALYDIGSLKSFKGIAEGVSNSNFLAETEAGRFILTLYEARTETAELPFFIALMEHLAKKGINCPQPILQRNGQALSELAGKPAALLSYLDGISLKKPTSSHCMEAGEALAKLHLAGQDFIMQRKNDLSVAGWKKLFTQAEAGAKAETDANSVQRDLRVFIADELTFLHENWPKNLPTGIIHADLFPDNVFFLNDKLSGLIDFYFACTDILAYDLAICLNAWVFETDGSFNVTKARSLLAGYQHIRPLSIDERDALPILVRGAALRFLLTRLVDWLNVPAGALVKPHDPLVFYKRLRFHQTLTSPSDLGLDL
jgi:homoserine kinase type II